MTTSTDPASPLPVKRNEHHDLVDMRPTQFDLTSGLFLTIILFLGVIVSGMFLLWTLNRWASRSEIRHSPPVATSFVAAGDRGSDNDFAIPGASEVRMLTGTSVNESLVAVNTAVESAAASLDAFSNQTRPNYRGGRLGPDGLLGIQNPEDDSVPRFERWQLNFVAADQASYAAQLDFFDMQLGIIGGGIEGIDLVSRLSTQPVAHHFDETAREKRLYFMWTAPNRLRDFEYAMLKQAGVTHVDRTVIRFIPDNLEHQLAVAELQFAKAAGHDSVTEIAKTVFASVAAGDGFAFEVIDQRYR